MQLLLFQSDLNEQMLMEEPVGYEQVDPEEWVCCLKTAPYGFKQASPQRHAQINEVLS